MVELVQNKRPDLDKVIQPETPEELGLIPAWSHSTLKTFETCAYRSYIAKVKRIQEDFGPAAARGTVIHQLAEDYVSGKLKELPVELNKFTSEFAHLRDMYELDKTELEGEWGFTIDWSPCGWMAKDVWARIKLDAILHDSPTSARVIDYKTGKMFGNEISHAQQALTYAIGSFFKFPELQHAQTELWYLDHGEITKQAYTRDEAMVFMPTLHKRAVDMTTAMQFMPNPSKTNCRWCSYKNGEYPHCQHGIK
jgi:CRISPR/Cas system-associated exonuclease Cas4 (RecB family)|tara:strand:+ start:5417 stop:6172 length:756 start_codon:yes stop_codon:yes gene_type:complete